MSKKVLTRTINVTGLTEEQHKQVRGKFNKAIGDIEIWIGKALEKNKKLKKEELRRAETKAEKDRIAKRKELEEEGKAKRHQDNRTLDDQKAKAKWSGRQLHQIQKEEQEAQESPEDYHKRMIEERPSGRIQSIEELQAIQRNAEIEQALEQEANDNNE